jgi:uncharacterized protein with von Willebrand factor type A (vWA) domain
MPAKWLPAKQSIIVLVDVSSSIGFARNQLAEIAIRVLEVADLEALHEGSALLLFGDSIVRDITLRDLRNPKEAEHEILGTVSSGTAIGNSILEAVTRLKDMPPPRYLTLLTDGRDVINVEEVCTALRDARITLEVYEIDEQRDGSLLAEVVRRLDAKYVQIRPNSI